MDLGYHIHLAWLWILLGFLSGALLGLGFHKEGWLGGYTSLRRRLYRLGHISFFALAVLNVVFFFTMAGAHASGVLLTASCSLVLGTITMPFCCLIMAHAPRLRLIFAVPVVSLITGAALGLFTELTQ